jgi:hypothetical protein
MNKKDYIDMFNGIIKGDPVPFKEKVIFVISDYLTEINYEKYLTRDILITDTFSLSKIN